MPRTLVDGRSYYSYGQVHRTLKQLAPAIQEFKPDLMIAIAGGGLIPARMLRTQLKVPIFVVCLKLYDETSQPGSSVVKIQWLDDCALQKIKGRRVLIVDEVDDSRTTLKFCIDSIRENCVPSATGVVVVHNKLRKKCAELPKDVVYFCGENVPDVWNCYPWDAADIDEHERKARHCAGESPLSAL